jgi:hypothetical protein
LWDFFEIMNLSHIYIILFLNVGRDHIQIDRLENSRMNRIVFPLTVDVHARIGGWVNLSSSDDF